MKGLSQILAILGVLLFIYAVIGRFVAGPTVFGYIISLDPKTVVLGANTLILLSVLITLQCKK